MIKKYHNGAWETIPYKRYETSADTLTTLPAEVIADGNNATVYLVGNMSQSGTPTPTTPITPSECGERTGNLFDKTAVVTGNILSDGTIGTNQAFRTSDYILATPNTNYAASYLTIAYRGRAVAFYQSDKTFISALQNNVESDDDTAPFTFVTPDNCYFIRIATYIEHTNHVDELMCNLGSTALPYEPWGIKIPILNNSQTTNVYLGEVQSTRQIKKLVLDGTEDWAISNTSQVLYVAMADHLLSNDLICYCSHYKSIANVSSMTTIADGECTFNNTLRWFYVKDNNYNDAVAFKAYLAQQYANGTPVTVWYVLAEPTTGVVNEPIRKIGGYADTVSGITVPTLGTSEQFDVDTTLKPSEVSLAYTGWHNKSDTKF